MTSKEELVKKFEDELDLLSKKIDQLEAKIKHDQARAGELEQQAVEKLISMRHTAKEKLQKFQESGDAHWEELQRGLEHYWQSLGIEIKAYDERL